MNGVYSVTWISTYLIPTFYKCDDKENHTLQSSGLIIENTIPLHPQSADAICRIKYEKQS